MNDDLTSHQNVTSGDADPVALFNEWLAEAEKGEPFNHNAVALATATPDGRPAVRMVLLQSADEAGFVFYTNSESRKGLEMAANARASLCFYWKSLRREVRIDGTVEKAGDEISDTYYASRPRGAQIGAWASDQSRPMADRFELERRVAKFTAKFHVGAVPRPPHWEGYRVIPEAIEFWTEKRFRLHERVLYTRSPGGWTTERLFP
jgi:pyridoxamine 5'-phosphate oxidase